MRCPHTSVPASQAAITHKGDTMQGIVKSLNDNRGLDFIEVEDHKRRYFRVRSEIMCAVVFAGPVAITAPVLAWVFLVY